MYGGTIYVKKSTNKGSTWTNANGGVPLSNASAPIIKMSVSQYSDAKLYAATVPGGGARSKLFRSTNGAGAFTEITGTLPDRYYTDIAIDPTNDDRVLVTLSGFGSGHVFFTNNQGNSWTDISAGLPDVPHNTAMFDPANPSTILIGNDLGVYYTTGFTDGSVAPVWSSYNDGLSDATMVMDIAVAANNKLRLGTHGKGLWETDMPVGIAIAASAPLRRGTTTEEQGAAVAKATVYPNPSTGVFNITLTNITKPGYAQVRIYSTSGVLVQQLRMAVQPGRNQLQGNIASLKSGIYQLVIETGNERIVQQLVKQ
jgi:hypothetical protein